MIIGENFAVLSYVENMDKWKQYKELGMLSIEHEQGERSIPALIYCISRVDLSDQFDTI